MVWLLSECLLVKKLHLQLLYFSLQIAPVHCGKLYLKLLDLVQKSSMPPSAFGDYRLLLVDLSLQVLYPHVQVRHGGQVVHLVLNLLDLGLRQDRNGLGR